MEQAKKNDIAGGSVYSGFEILEFNHDWAMDVCLIHHIN